MPQSKGEGYKLRNSDQQHGIILRIWELGSSSLFSYENQEYAIVRSIDGKIPQMT